MFIPIIMPRPRRRIMPIRPLCFFLPSGLGRAYIQTCRSPFVFRPRCLGATLPQRATSRTNTPFSYLRASYPSNQPHASHILRSRSGETEIQGTRMIRTCFWPLSIQAGRPGLISGRRAGQSRMQRSSLAFGWAGRMGGGMRDAQREVRGRVDRGLGSWSVVRGGIVMMEAGWRL